MMTIHTDLWVPGKTLSFDGYTGLMIIVCHMTGFAAIEPVIEATSESLAKAVYKIFMRYGLCHMIMINPDSKCKGRFKGMTALLTFQHHMCARGHHDTILVERFNRFLNSALTVFDNDRESNMVFIEGSFTVCYTWNSVPVATTDLSRSLLVVGREYHFPIGFQSRSYITCNLSKRRIR